MVASSQGHSEIIKILVSHGADVHRIENSYVSILQKLKSLTKKREQIHLC